MKFTTLPRGLNDAYGLTIFVLRLWGLFPYYYDVQQRKFRISSRIYLISLIHLVIYSLVNFQLILYDWREYIQPIVGNSQLTAWGNFIIRLLGVIITILILLQSIFVRRGIVEVLNNILRLMDLLEDLGIDINPIYQRVRIYGPLLTLTMTGVVTFNSWHVIHFYKEITQHQPDLKYFVAIVLSDIYKAMTLSRMWIILLSLYLLSQRLNSFLTTFLHTQEYRTKPELHALIVKKVATMKF